METPRPRPSGLRTVLGSRPRAGLAWGLAGVLLAALVWVAGVGYDLDVGGFFWGAVAGVIVWLLVAKRFGRGLIFHNLANTALLFLLALAVAEGMASRNPPEARTVPAGVRAYSYEVARGDPLLFRHWWESFVREWSKLFRTLRMPDPNRRLPFRLRPNTEMLFMRSRISVNSLGFRDREFARDKGDAFRIVALGESTTMGVTLEPEDRPWPVALEELLRGQLPAGRRVEVINAGVAAYTLEDGLVRLREDVLPLKPDLLLSYHGYNGFRFLTDAPTDLRESPPHRRPRPSRLLAGLEYRLALRAYWRRAAVPDLSADEIVRLESGAPQSRYATLYRELIEVAREADIPLVLASFNMAVKAGSPAPVIDFYRAGFPSVLYSIPANRVHNGLIAALARQHEGVHFIETAAGLDGVHEHFIDLVHFTQSGREILARNILKGLLEVLKAESLLVGHPAGGG